MDEQHAASQPTVTEPAREGLRRNSLNLPRLAFIGLAYFSLAPVIYLNMGFMETDSGGPVMPFLFILITIAVLPTAISFAVLNNRRPSAGAGYTWLWESTYPGVGLWLGWIMITTYVVVSALYPVAFGTFFNALLTYFHVTATTWTGIGGGVAAIVIIGYLNHNNIKLSSTVIGDPDDRRGDVHRGGGAGDRHQGRAPGAFQCRAVQPARRDRRVLGAEPGRDLRVLVDRRGRQRGTGGRGGQYPAAAHPARDDPDHGDRGSVLDPYFVRVRDLGAGAHRRELRERRPDHAGPADLAVLHRRLGGAGAHHRIHRRAGELRRVAVRGRADHLRGIPGRVPVQLLHGPAPQVPDPLAGRGVDPPRGAGVPVRASACGRAARPTRTATWARSSCSSSWSCTSS